MEIYEKIKNRRKELGLSADDVAESLGVSRATIYRYESADIEKLPITSLVPLAKILKCSPGYLMGWDDDSDGGIDNIWHPNYKMYNDLLEDEDFCLLLEAAAGCTKSQIKMATNMLHEFKNPAQ